MVDLLMVSAYGGLFFGPLPAPCAMSGAKLVLFAAANLALVGFHCTREHFQKRLLAPTASVVHRILLVSVP